MVIRPATTAQDQDELFTFFDRLETATILVRAYRTAITRAPGRTRTNSGMPSSPRPASADRLCLEPPSAHHVLNRSRDAGLAAPAWPSRGQICAPRLVGHLEESLQQRVVFYDYELERLDLYQGDGDGPAGQVKVVDFRVLGQRFVCIDSRSNTNGT